MDITQVLNAASSQNPQEQQEASRKLEELKNGNYVQYIGSLATHLADDSKPPPSRQMAALLLRHNFESKDMNQYQTLIQSWSNVPQQPKNEIRRLLLQSLHSSSHPVRIASAQTLAAVAQIDLPMGQWLEVIESLQNNVLKPSTEYGIESSLTALGYICEKTRTESLSKQSNLILNAVMEGTRSQNENIQLAAVTALLHSLDYASNNFAVEKERNYIMERICHATQSGNVLVRRKAMEAIARIAYLHYQFLPPYFSTLSAITSKAAREDQDEKVSLQGIEFFSTLAELEAEILEEIDEAKEANEQPPRECYQFISNSLVPLVELLCELLVRQDENQTEDEWNISSAAGTCLSLVSHVVGSGLVGIVMNFVGKNINNQDWHYREAAILAFSAILDAPQSKDMNKLVDEAMPYMLRHSKDNMHLVKDTTIFAIGRIANFQPAVLTEKYLGQVLQCLLEATTDEEASIASKACWAIHNLVEQFGSTHDYQATYPLSAHFQNISAALLKCSLRNDISESNLRINVYEALAALIRGAPRDTHEFLKQKIMPEVVTRLSQSIQNRNPNEELQMVQGLLCGTLTVCIEKLSRELTEQHADILMQIFLNILQTSPAVFEDVIVAVGVLVDARGEHFLKYMQHFLPALITGLKKQEHTQVCIVCVNLVGTLCTALQSKIEIFSDALMTILLENLQSNLCHRDVKPHIISVFSDLALALGGKFEKYMDAVGSVLSQASKATVDPNNTDMVDYLNILRENIFEAYIGILQGIKTEKPHAFHKYINDVFTFLHLVCEDQNTDTDVFKAAVNVIGDLANVYGSKIGSFLSQPFVSQMIQDAKVSEDRELQRSGQYAEQQVSTCVL